MIRSTARRGLLGTFAAVGFASCAALLIPTASAEPDPSTPAPAPAPVVDDCNAATLSKTISTVTAQLSTYFAAHPDANQALIDATRLGSFQALGAFDSYFNEHPDEANDLRAIQAPLAEYKDRCGMQVSPTDALTVLAEV